MLDEAELKLLNAAIRTNAIVMAVAFGLLGGVILWLATAILLLRGGENVGAHLALLSIFLPGYSVTWAGAWIGLGWGLVCGALSGAALYWGYARTLRERLMSAVVEVTGAGPLAPPIFLMSGNALGLALGALMALQLFLTTNWLVVRGTASNSYNAALLAQYLTGYTVSFRGSVVGAIELFAVTFIAAHVMAASYNFVVRWRVRS